MIAPLIVSGRPRTVLPATAFVGFRARRLRHARVVWVNWSLLHEWGMPVPAGGLTPELERWLLDRFAWVVPVTAGDGRTEHVGPAKRFHADRYAGEGVGINAGSGRAGVAGALQIKGIGVTPLAHPDSDYEHRHGALYLEEAMREAIWSELDHLETPHGANRVVAVIDAMVVVPMPDGRRRRRGLVVRPFALRPAHYLVSQRYPVDPRDFRARQRTILQGFADLTEARGRGGSGRRLRAGFLAFVDRLAAQHATLMVQRIPHGGLSASNVELGGRLLDFGSQTSQTGHGNTLILRHTPFQSNALHYILDSVRALASSVGLGLSPELARAIPDPDRLVDRFRLRHAETLFAGLIALCGFPRFLLRHEAETAAYWKLARALEAVAFPPGPPLIIERRMPRWVGDVDVAGLLYALACLRRHDRARVTALLARDRDGQVAAVIDAYFELREALDRHAGGYGLAEGDLDDLIIRLASIRNDGRPTLYVRRLRRANSQLLRRYVASGDRQLIADRIEQLIARNRRVFADAPGCCTLREWQDPRTGSAVRYVFVPRRGYALELSVPGGERRRAAVIEAGVDRVHEIALRQRDGIGVARVWLDPTITCVRAGVRPDPLRRFDLLPRLYFDGVTAITRGTTLRRAVVPPRLPGDRGVARERDRPYQSRDVRARDRRATAR